MAIDPSGKPLFADPAEMQRFHKDLAKLDKSVSLAHVFGTALDGALLGAAIGFAVHYKNKGHRELGKHALYGAGIGGGLALIGYVFGKSISAAGHFVEAEGKREMAGQPTRMERMFPLPTDRPGAVAASGWWDRHEHRDLERLERERFRHRRHRRPGEVVEEEIIEQPVLAAGDVRTGWWDRYGRWHHHHRPYPVAEEVVVEQQPVFAGYAPMPYWSPETPWFGSPNYYY